MGFLSSKKKEENLYAQINLDIETFDLIGTDKNLSGIEFEIYIKYLDELQFDLFDKIDMYVFPDGSKNIFLTNYIYGIDYELLKSFVNRLVKRYGKDFVGSGLMDEHELNNLVIESFWVGRTWDKITPMISIDAVDEEFVRLSILGI